MYVANSKNNTTPDEPSSSDGFDMVIFHRDRENGRLSSFDDVDQRVEVLAAIMFQ